MTLQHNTRERQPKNADPAKTEKNWSLGGGSLEVMNRYHERLPNKVRANAVYAIELLMTASPEFSGDWTKYLDACDRWAMELFGGKENLLHIAHHRDEETPHTHILFMPLKDGKLNSKYFIGGHRDRLIEIQNDFYEKVGRQFELERGKPKTITRAKHEAHTLNYKATELDEKEAILNKQEAEIKKDKALYENVWKRANAITTAAEETRKDLPRATKEFSRILEHFKKYDNQEREKVWVKFWSGIGDFISGLGDQVREEMKAERLAKTPPGNINVPKPLQRGKGSSR